MEGESSKKAEQNRDIEPKETRNHDENPTLERTKLNMMNDKPEELLLSSLIDDVISIECQQVFRAAQRGAIFIEPVEEQYRIKEGVDVDIFGQPLGKKKQYNCTCPNCGRNLAASRLAPHLEKCMGMGRLSARQASNKPRDQQQH